MGSEICVHDFVCTMCLQSHPDFPTTRAKYESENAALRERVAHVERDFARLNAEETALREKLAVAVAGLTEIADISDCIFDNVHRVARMALVVIEKGADK